MTGRQGSRGRRDQQPDDNEHEESAIPRDLQRVVDQQSSMEDTIDSAHKYMVRHRPPLTAQQFRRMLPQAQIDADWTAAEEAQLNQAWQNDPMRTHMLDGRGNKNLGVPWRYAIRFQGTFVEEIIGPRFGLEYDNSGNTQILVNGQSVPHPYWSTGFCDKLSCLLPHQMWLGKPGPLTVCLQYGVKCRTNDQRQMRWPRQNYTTDKFFDVFQEVSETFQDGTKTVVGLHDEVRQRMGDVESPYSLLFRTIEELVFDADLQPLRGPNSGSDVGTYKVSTNDLSALVKALDSETDIHGLPLYRPAELTAAMVKAAKRNFDFPRKNDLEDSRELVLLSIQRDQAKVGKQGLLHPSHQQQPQQEDENEEDEDQDEEIPLEDIMDLDDGYVPVDTQVDEALQQPRVQQPPPPPQPQPSLWQPVMQLPLTFRSWGTQTENSSVPRRNEKSPSKDDSFTANDYYASMYEWTGDSPIPSTSDRQPSKPGESSLPPRPTWDSVPISRKRIVIDSTWKFDVPPIIQKETEGRENRPWLGPLFETATVEEAMERIRDLGGL